MIRITGFVFLGLAICSAYAVEPPSVAPFEVKGFSLGMSPKAVKSRFKGPLKCKAPDDVRGMLCSFSFNSSEDEMGNKGIRTIADQAVWNYLFDFDGDKLVRMAIWFNSSYTEYLPIEGALTSKFGQPVFTVKPRRYAKWQRGGQTILLDESLMGQHIIVLAPVEN